MLHDMSDVKRYSGPTGPQLCQRPVASLLNSLFIVTITSKAAGGWMGAILVRTLNDAYLDVVLRPMCAFGEHRVGPAAVLKLYLMV